MTTSTKQIIADTNGRFNSNSDFDFGQALRPSREAVVRAEALLGRARKAAGEDRFPAAVACALLYRGNGHTELDAQGFLENLNQAVFEPPLEPSRLDDALFAAYAEPAVAEQIIADALSAAANDARVRADISPPGAPVRGESQATSGTDAHEVLVVELDQRGGGKETLLKLQAAGKDCPMAKTMTARSPSRVLRFIHTLPPDTRVMEGAIGRGIKVFGCNESAALEGFEIINDLPRASPRKSVSARFTVPAPSKAPVGENISVITKTTGNVGRPPGRSDELVITKNPRKVGRPPGRTKDKPFQMRVDDAFITKIDDWRRQQLDFPNRTESVRRLVEQALNGRRG